jgi:cyclic pyranopterin phosphate synthase
MLRAMAHVNPGGTIYAFERIARDLPFMPLSARRTLDAIGQHLSLEGWLSLPVGDRWRLVRAGSDERVEPEAEALLAHATPQAGPSAVLAEPDPRSVPPGLLAALGASRPLHNDLWANLDPLGRYSLVKCTEKPERLAAAYDEIVGTGVSRMPHLTAAGHAHMVNVGSKAITARAAIASASVRSLPAVVSAVAGGAIPKGDVLAAARIAGLLAAKRTAELIPLCHPVSTTSAAIDFDLAPTEGTIRVRAAVEAIDRTGVEMEAMVAASVAALTIYDMIKGIDRWASIDAVRLEEKRGGKSGHVRRPVGRSAT